jgi:hypothetical protein
MDTQGCRIFLLCSDISKMRALLNSFYATKTVSVAPKIRSQLIGYGISHVIELIESFLLEN